MNEAATLRFASSAWWAEHPRTDLVVVHAILSLATVDRTPEQIWSSPTREEWRQVAELAAEYSDPGDFALAGDQMAWRILSRTFRGGGAPFSL